MRLLERCVNWPGSVNLRTIDPMGAKHRTRWAVIGLLSLALVAGIVAAVRGPREVRPDPSHESLATETTTVGPLVAPDTMVALSPDRAEPVAPAGDGSSLSLSETSCLTGEEHAPTGELIVVPGNPKPTGSSEITSYSVEVEDGLAVDVACFAEEVDRILADDRSWAGDGTITLRRVDADPVDFRVTLASPATTDLHCRPLETNGIYSCFATDGRAMINVWRWEHGTEEYSDDLDTYREYVINHEVGHALGHGHVQCPAEGELAPVMAQQTKTLDGCAQNGWPLTWER